MGDSMDSYRSRFQHHSIHRSRSPSCLNYFNRDPQNHQLNFWRLRHGRHDLEKKTPASSCQAFDFTPISLQSPPPLNIHNRSFSYDDQVLSMGSGKLAGLTDLDSSPQKIALDNIIGRLSERCATDSSNNHDFCADPGLPSDDRPARSLSVPAPIDRRADSARFGTASEAGRLNDYEFPRNQSNQNYQLQSSSAVNEESYKNDSHRTSHDESPELNEKEQKDGPAFLQGLDQVTLKESLDTLASTNVLDTLLPSTSVRTAPLSKANPAPSPYHCGLSRYHRPQMSCSPVIGTTTTVAPIATPSESKLPHAIPTPLSSADLPPQAYPGKANPLLPPPLPSPKPRHQISFPRPFRRRLSVTEPATVPLPLSPPPEFDFGTFENSLDIYSCNLLDDTPYVPIFEKPLDDSEPLIDLAFDEVTHTTDIKQNKTGSAAKDVSTAKPHGRFTPLPSPVFSERFLLDSLLASPPSSDYVPLGFRRKCQDNLEQTKQGNHPEPEASGQVTPHQLALEPEPSNAISQRSNSTSCSRSSQRPPSRLSSHSQPTCDQQNSSSVQTSRSCHPSMNQSITEPCLDKSGVVSLTEMALQRHLSYDESKAASDCTVAHSRVAPSLVAVSRAPSIARSSTSHRTSGKQRDSRLENLMELGALRKAQRAEELSQRRLETERYFIEQDKDLDALLDMILELKEMRKRHWNNLSGDAIDSQVDGGSPPRSSRVGSPNITLQATRSSREPLPSSHQHSTSASTSHPRVPLMMKHATLNKREASVATNMRVKLMENTSPSPRAMASTKAHSIAEVITPSQWYSGVPSFYINKDHPQRENKSLAMATTKAHSIAAEVISPSQWSSGVPSRDSFYIGKDRPQRDKKKMDHHQSMKL